MSGLAYFGLYMLVGTIIAGAITEYYKSELHDEWPQQLVLGLIISLVWGIVLLIIPGMLGMFVTRKIIKSRAYKKILNFINEDNKTITVNTKTK